MISGPAHTTIMCRLMRGFWQRGCGHSCQASPRLPSTNSSPEVASSYWATAICQQAAGDPSQPPFDGRPLGCDTDHAGLSVDQIFEPFSVAQASLPVTVRMAMTTEVPLAFAYVLLATMCCRSPHPLPLSIMCHRRVLPSKRLEQPFWPQTSDSFVSILPSSRNHVVLPALCRLDLSFVCALERRMAIS